MYPASVARFLLILLLVSSCPAKDRPRYKLTAVLCSLTILDMKFTQVSYPSLLRNVLSNLEYQIAQNAANNRVKRLMQPSPLKRNNNYYDDEERASTRMRIEEAGDDRGSGDRHTVNYDDEERATTSRVRIGGAGNDTGGAVIDKAAQSEGQPGSQQGAGNNEEVAQTIGQSERENQEAQAGNIAGPRDQSTVSNEIAQVEGQNGDNMVVD